jgi:hypothetical protein
MLDSLYFACSLAGIAWLIIWTVRAERDDTSRMWSPFDINLPDEPSSAALSQTGTRRRHFVARRKRNPL